MKKQNIYHFFSACQKNMHIFINIILYLVIIVMPFIVADTDNRKYVDGKAIFLYVAASLLIVMILFAGNNKFRKEHVIALIFVLSLVIAACFSHYKQVAFFGNNERIEGALMYLVYIVLFYAASKYLELNEMIIKLILSAGCIMAIYAVVQMFGIDPIQKMFFGQIVTPTVSVSLIGNYNFVSTYMCMFIFISVALYIYKKDIFYLGTSIILFLGLLASRTRGGWITFIIVSVIGLIFILKKKDCLIRAGFVFVMFFVSFIILNKVSGNMILDRADINNIVKFSKSNIIENDKLCSITNSNNIYNVRLLNDNKDSNLQLVGSASSRTNIYKMAFKAFLDRPLLGEGPDTLGLRLKNDYSKEYYKHMSLYNEAVDKAHNEYLEYAVSGGIFTLISYLALVTFALYKLYNRRKNNDYVIIMLGIIAYLVQAFVNISVIMVAPLFWILLGYAYNRCAGVRA